MFYILKYIPGVLIFIMVNNMLNAMDPKKSLLDLPHLALVKILADEKLKVKDRIRLMQTCHKLHVLTSPRNLLQETLPLNLFRNISWPFLTLDVAVKNANHACCMHIIDTEQLKIKKQQKTWSYKIKRNKYFDTRLLRLYSMCLQFRVSLSYDFIFYQKDSYYPEEYPDDPAHVIPLIGDKNKLIALFKAYGHPNIAENYLQAQNISQLKQGKVLALRKGLSYPPNLLGHACVFGNREMLREIVDSCKNMNDLLMYSPYPVSALALAAEYDNPECFKMLYQTPWLKKYFRLYSRPKNQPLNHLETFIFYIHHKKIIETLLKSGCYDLNDIMHVINISTDKDELSISNKYFQGKTLLDIVLIEKDKVKNNPLFDVKKHMPVSVLTLLDDTYYESIIRLLRKYGGKTAQEIAAIYPFNELMPDIQKNIVYRLSLLHQHKSRLVSSLWKNIIDDNPFFKNSGSYLTLLRNSKPQYTIFQNCIRVLLGAMYYKNYAIVDLIVQNFSQKPIVSGTYTSCLIKDTLREFPCVYNWHQFVRDTSTKKILEEHYGEGSKPAAKDNIYLLNAIAASFLNDTVELEKILRLILTALCLQDNTSRVISDHDIKKTLLHTSRIIIDYDYPESMTVFIDILKDTDFFAENFTNLILISYILKSPKVLKVLLSSEMDINRVNDQNQTIKDMIVNETKTHPDMCYALHVKYLLDTYGAKTYKELITSYSKNR